MRVFVNIQGMFAYHLPQVFVTTTYESVQAVNIIQRLLDPEDKAHAPAKSSTTTLDMYIKCPK